ncbi:hypothetical protein ACFL6G_09780 [candidate division KSB1 bacterium]
MNWDIPLYFSAGTDFRKMFNIDDPPMTLILSKDSRLFFRNSVHLPEKEYAELIESKLAELSTKDIKK